MSLRFPIPRDTKGGVEYPDWKRDEPMVLKSPQICHGLDRMKEVPRPNIFKANDVITVTLDGSSSHSGGHCSFWWSTDEADKWYKIIDMKDCTLAKKGVPVMIPKDMATACADRCVFAWTWVPLLSLTPELYMTCADIRVSGVTGVGSKAITLNIDQFNQDPSSLKRVDELTHFSSSMGTLKTAYNEDDGAPKGSKGIRGLIGKGKFSSSWSCPYKNQGTNGNSGGTSGNSGGTSTSRGRWSWNGRQWVWVTCRKVNKNGRMVTKDKVTHCQNPRAFYSHYNLHNDGRCLLNNGKWIKNRCDIGQCCSAGGFCGPVYDGKKKAYVNFGADPSGNVLYDSPAEAFNDYCGPGNQADYRLVQCDEKTDDSSEEPDKDGKSDSSDQSSKLKKTS